MIPSSDLIIRVRKTQAPLLPKPKKAFDRIATKKLSIAPRQSIGPLRLPVHATLCWSQAKGTKTTKSSQITPFRSMTSRSRAARLKIILWSFSYESADAFSNCTVRRSVAFIRGRSEEHTSELQSRQYLVCRLLLEKKKKK